MRIVFMGTPDFAIPSLEKLLSSGHKIVAVVTGPDKPEGRGQVICSTPVREFALKQGLPVLCPIDLRSDEFHRELSSFNPELGVVVAFRILPERIFGLPSKGTINLHASLLPRYRGAAPINWVLIKGESKTGLTTFFIQRRVDTGSIILQRETDILPDETFGDLSIKLAKIGADLLLETIDLVQEGGFQPKTQDDSQASLAPKITKEMCKIDWSRSALEIKNLIRGLSPVPAAHAFFEGGVLKIFKAKIPDAEFPETKEGEIIQPEHAKSFVVKTKDKALELLEVQLQGKKRMSGEEFIRGCRFGLCHRLD